MIERIKYRDIKKDFFITITLFEKTFPYSTGKKYQKLYKNNNLAVSEK
ncbi:MAG: hypothetical protein HOP31_02780 [Ignavibacteria bacterium]|nr:hypothetical protein [Ignavibacteria bacterium]